jgi:sulfur carrier protein
MEIQLNGEPHTAPEDATLQVLIESIGIDPSRIAVELDGVIVRRGEWPTTSIRPGSKVEVVQFVGGGC